MSIVRKLLEYGQDTTRKLTQSRKLLVFWETNTVRKLSPDCTTTWKLWWQSPYLGAIGSDDYLRVCPSIRSHRGWAWAKDPLQATHWFIDVSVRIAGRLKTGADGMVRCGWMERELRKFVCLCILRASRMKSACRGIFMGSRAPPPPHSYPSIFAFKAKS